MQKGKVIQVEGNQTIFDIAIQYYGSVDAFFMVLEDNPDLFGIDVALKSGQLLNIIQEPVNKEVVEFYRKKKYVPVSEVDDYPEFEIDNGGDFNLEDFFDEDFY